MSEEFPRASHFPHVRNSWTLGTVLGRILSYNEHDE